MFNFFKSKKAKQIDIITELPTEETVDIDKQIYEDVYSAQELILAEAKAIIATPNIHDEEKYNRLHDMYRLGFSSASEIKQFKELDDKKKAQEELKNAIEYYQQTYPLNKFINQESVNTICKKYNLLLTVASDYIAEIPDNNQKEIVNFRIKRKDAREPYEVYSGMPSFSFHHPIFYGTQSRSDYQNEMLKGQSLLIIAPEHKLNTYGKERQGHILKIKDPIVLQPVNGGYLIVSSWGLEASDELVVNAINN